MDRQTAVNQQVRMIPHQESHTLEKFYKYSPEEFHSRSGRRSTLRSPLFFAPLCAAPSGSA